MYILVGKCIPICVYFCIYLHLEVLQSLPFFSSLQKDPKGTQKKNVVRELQLNYNSRRKNIKEDAKE